MQKQLLIVANQPSPNTTRLANAVARGANHEDLDAITVVLRKPADACADDVLNSHGIIIGTTENFSYMSGAIKDFFERIYYPCLEQTQGLPYALYVKAGNDGTGACSSIERIVTGLRWSVIQPFTVLKGDFDDDFVTQCEELGMLMSAGLEAGIY